MKDDSFERLDLSTRVVVLRHRREVYKTTNTGRLVALALANAEIRVFGERHDVLREETLVDPERVTLLLYPSSDAIALEQATPSSRPVTLIVPDANWRRAFKLTTREPALERVQRVCLPSGPPSRYRLRRHPEPSYVATFEAVARALGVLEGPTVQAQLERFFDAWVERRLRERGVVDASPAS